MPIRKETASISYPFVPEVPDRKYIAGIKDARFHIQGLSVSTSTALSQPYTYLKSITQGAGTVTYVFESVIQVGTEVYGYSSSFLVTVNQGLVGVYSDSSYMVVNSDFVYTTDNLVMTSPLYILEPARVFWFNSSIESINFVNEFRHFDPAQRLDLPNTILKTFSAPEDIKIRSGYNVNLTYAPTSGVLDIDGNADNGLGLAPDNMWDTGPSWEVGVEGVLSINGILADSNGNIPITRSNSIQFTTDIGSIIIKVT